MDDDALLDAMNSLVISPFSSLGGMMYRGEISSGLQLMGLVSRAMNIQAEDEQRNETLNSQYTEIRKSVSPNHLTVGPQISVISYYS